METILVSLICIALIVFGGMTMSQGFMTTVDTSTTGLEDVRERGETLIRTELTPVSSSLTAANTLEVILENTGQAKLADFDKWDFIIQYYDDMGTFHSTWLPYTSGTLGDNEWGVSEILLNGEAEIYEPNVLNQSESILLVAQLEPAVGDNTTNMVVIATPEGITASTYFTR
ncbi:MAG TPA: hypothetical protein G4O16_08400 [Dehalococcoidia bacterium]|nr:hypothetical protein [Dehalococcoidia bacterium]